MTSISSHIMIPAYSAEQAGLIFSLRLVTNTHPACTIHTYGTIAQALENSLRRMLSIMSSLKNEWRTLTNFGYTLHSETLAICVKDARSASLALAIALLNIYRQIQQQPVVPLTGTGIVRIDGSIESAQFEQCKRLALRHCALNPPAFLTASDCRHLFQLESLMHMESINLRSTL